MQSNKSIIVSSVIDNPMDVITNLPTLNVIKKILGNSTAYERNYKQS